MSKTIPEHLENTQSVLDSIVHLVGKAEQVAYNLDEISPRELKLRLTQLCVATEQAAAFVNLVDKWCGCLPAEIIDQIPTWVLLQAESNSKE